MNIGVFTDNDFEKVNGVTTSLRAVIQHAPSGMRVRVYTCDSTGADTPTYLALRARGVGIPFYSEMKMDAPPFRALLRHAAADRLDVVHLTTPGPLGLAAMWVAARLGIPMVGSFHTHLAEYTATLSGMPWLGRLMQEYLRWPYGQCRLVLAPSDSTRAVLVAGKISPSKIRLWKRGVSTTLFAPPKRLDALRGAWGVADDRPAVLYVGRISREKGLGDLGQVRRTLQARGIQHRFVFVGDGPLRPALQETFHDAVFTGTLSPQGVAVAMASSDVFVFPSRTDTAGNVILEAQASGLPVIVTNEGGPRENVVAGETGYVCGSTRDISNAVMELCVDKGSRDRMSIAAREYALSRNWDDALAPLYQSYRDAAIRRITVPTAASDAATA